MTNDYRVILLRYHHLEIGVFPYLESVVSTRVNFHFT